MIRLPGMRSGLALIFFLILSVNAYGQSVAPSDLTVMDAGAYRASLNENPAYKLVPLDSNIPLLKKDIRYAGANNFTGRKIYQSPGAFARRDVAQALKEAANALEKLGLGLILFDAYRPFSATKTFWELIGDERYVASPLKGSRHNRGAAVDVALYQLSDGKPLEMPTDYDDFSERAHSRATMSSKEAGKNRSLLQKIMTDAGFELFETEWWHFDFKGWNRYPLMDVSFEEL